MNIKDLVKDGKKVRMGDHLTEEHPDRFEILGEIAEQGGVGRLPRTKI